MSRIKLSLAVASLAALASIQTVSAQLPGGLPGIGGSGSASAAASAAVDRAQAQVQQRVQAQVQQRLQAQLQTRVQAQAQARIQAEANRAANIALRAAASAENRARGAADQVPNGLQVGLGANANSRTNANAFGQSANMRSNTNIGLSANAGLPGISEADVAIYDSIFGQFNPMRQSMASADPNAANAPATPSVPGMAQPASGSETETESTSPQTGSTSLLSTNLDFSSRLQVAAQQRRAEISQMRDQAVESGSVELMERADVIESRLNAFTKAQADLSTSTQASGSATVEIADRFGADMSSRLQGRANSLMRVGSQAQGQAQSQARSQSQAALQAASQNAAAAQANGQAQGQAASQQAAESAEAWRRAQANAAANAAIQLNR